MPPGINRANVIILMVVLILPVAFLYPFAESGGEHLDGAFKRALAGAAIARGLNGVISVAQGTEFAVQPAGIGVVLAPGEILDPINDLVERFSWIMLLASSSLGVQQVLLAMSAWHGILVGLTVGGILLVAVSWFGGSNWGWLRSFLFRFFLLMTMLRFIEEVISRPVEESSGIIGKAKEIYRSAKKQIAVENRFDDYGRIAETVSENIIWLISVFLMQTLVFPLLFLWIVYVLLRQLFRVNLK